MVHIFRQLAGPKLSAKHSKPVPTQSSLWQQINYGTQKRQMYKTISIQQVRNIQLRTESRAATRVMTHDKDEMNCFLPLAGRRLHGKNICTVSCLTFNCTILSLEIRCTNEASCFSRACWGIIAFSLMPALRRSHCSPSEQRSPYSWGARGCWLMKATTAGPGRSTGFGPAEDNCFSSRWGQQQTAEGRSPSPPENLSERSSAEDALLGRHLRKTEIGAGCG